MNAKVTLSIIGVILILLLTGFFTLPISPTSKTYDLTIIKIGDNWKVVDANDHTKTKVKVKKKDTIVWSVSGTDAYFQFPLELFDAVSSADSLKNGYTNMQGINSMQILSMNPCRMMSLIALLILIWS